MSFLITIFLLILIQYQQIKCEKIYSPDGCGRRTSIEDDWAICCLCRLVRWTQIVVSISADSETICRQTKSRMIIIILKCRLYNETDIKHMNKYTVQIFLKFVGNISFGIIRLVFTFCFSIKFLKDFLVTYKYSSL